MGVLKLSVIEEQNKMMENKMKSAKQKGKANRISNCFCPCEAFIKEGEIAICESVASTSNWKAN